MAENWWNVKYEWSKYEIWIVEIWNMKSGRLKIGDLPSQNLHKLLIKFDFFYIRLVQVISFITLYGFF